MRWLCTLFLFLALVPSARGASSEKGNNLPPPIHDHQMFWFLLLDQFEVKAAEGADAVAWDASGWVGGDYNRLWLKTEGERINSDEGRGEFEVQALFGRLISPFWDIQAGVRHDRSIGKGVRRFRSFAVFGAQGTAQYWFELEPALFISEDGDLSLRLSGEYELLVTQRVLLQPAFELNAALQEVQEFGVGRGLNGLELGLRLRYEVMPEFAPYLGVLWRCAFGETADLARKEGEDATSAAFVGGVRMWF